MNTPDRMKADRLAARVDETAADLARRIKDGYEVTREQVIELAGQGIEMLAAQRQHRDAVMQAAADAERIQLVRFNKPPADRTVIVLDTGVVSETYYHPELRRRMPFVRPRAGSDGAIMLAAIEARPGDRTAELVYADWLQENGHGHMAESVRAGFWRTWLAREAAFPALVGPDGFPPHPLCRAVVYLPLRVMPATYGRGDCYRVRRVYRGNARKWDVTSVPSPLRTDLPAAFDVVPVIRDAWFKGGVS